MAAPSSKRTVYVPPVGIVNLDIGKAEMDAAAIEHSHAKLRRANQERHEERESEWQQWRDTAAAIRKKHPTLSSKRELARRVKAALDLTDPIETIRKRL